jgi:putative transposase
MCGYLQKQFGVSIKRSCSVVALHRSMWYYQSKKDDQAVIDKLSELAEKLPTRGFDEYYGRIRQEGLIWNRKRVLRVYRKMRLGLRRKYKKRLPQRVQEPLVEPQTPNETWSMDFMSDALSDGRKIRVLNIIDDFNREVLRVKVGLSFPAERVVRVLRRLEEERGLPQHIRVDNGPEFIAKAFQNFCKGKVEIKYIQPGKPTQNAYIERLNRQFREDVLDAYLFENLEQVAILAEDWRRDYNQNHPHKSLGGKSPRQVLGGGGGGCGGRHPPPHKPQHCN